MGSIKDLKHDALVHTPSLKTWRHADAIAPKDSMTPKYRIKSLQSGFCGPHPGLLN